MGTQLSDRRILVTGAASGMGRAIADLFVQEGSRVVMLDRNGEGVQVAAEQLGAAASFACDVADRAATAGAVTKAVAALGGLDGVVNAAGILDITPFKDLSGESWDAMMAVNVTGPFNVIRAALPALEAAAQATIVNIASTSALMPMPGTSGYSASKAALLMFTKCLAMDLGPNIRANSICPGFIKTEMTRHLWENPEHAARAGDRVALKRTGEADDVARVALFFTSAQSAFTTGAWVPVDGGFAWR